MEALEPRAEAGRRPRRQVNTPPALRSEGLPGAWPWPGARLCGLNRSTQHGPWPRWPLFCFVFLLLSVELFHHFMVRVQEPARSPGAPGARSPSGTHRDAAGVPGNTPVTDSWRGQGWQAGAEGWVRERATPLSQLTETVGTAVGEERLWLLRKAGAEPQLGDRTLVSKTDSGSQTHWLPSCVTRGQFLKPRGPWFPSLWNGSKGSAHLTEPLADLREPRPWSPGHTVQRVIVPTNPGGRPRAVEQPAP